jgi:hypothetical protein
MIKAFFQGFTLPALWKFIGEMTLLFFFFLLFGVVMYFFISRLERGGK